MTLSKSKRVRYGTCRTCMFAMFMEGPVKLCGAPWLVAASSAPQAVQVQVG